MVEPALVTYQITERNQNVTSFRSAPAIVTSRVKRAFPQLDANGVVMKDANGVVLLGPEIDVLSLTVCLVGAFEFKKDVFPYTDEIGLKAGADSYREIGSAAPVVKPVAPPVAPVAPLPAAATTAPVAPLAAPSKTLFPAT